jgi:hypothetical protein
MDVSTPGRQAMIFDDPTPDRRNAPRADIDVTSIFRH